MAALFLYLAQLKEDLLFMLYSLPSPASECQTMSLLMESGLNFNYNCFWQNRCHFSSDYKEMKHKPTSILITFLSFLINCSSPFSLIYDYTVVSITIITLFAVLSITIVTSLFSILHNTIL